MAKKKKKVKVDPNPPIIVDGYIRFVSWAEDMPKIMKWAEKNNVILGKEVYQEHGDYIRTMLRIMDPKDQGRLFVPFTLRVDTNISDTSRVEIS